MWGVRLVVAVGDPMVIPRDSGAPARQDGCSLGRVQLSHSVAGQHTPTSYSVHRLQRADNDYHLATGNSVTVVQLFAISFLLINSRASARDMCARHVLTLSLAVFTLSTAPLSCEQSISAYAG